MVLTLHRHGERRYYVFSGRWCCGLIQHERNIVDPAQAWRWIVHVGGDRLPGAVFDGRCGSLAAAMAAFKENWTHWLDSAGLTDERWVEATDAATGWRVCLNVSRARTIVGLPEGTVVQFTEDDAITVREEPEVLRGAAGRPRPEWVDEA